MTDYILATGSSGNMIIRDDGRSNVDFYVQSVVSVSIPEMPWTFTLNGITEGWRSFEVLEIGQWQFVTSLYVGYSQTVTFKLGDTGTTSFGGPTDHAVYIQRGASVGVARIKSGTVHQTASAYVKDGGVWKPAEVWVRSASIWKRTE